MSDYYHYRYISVRLILTKAWLRLCRVIPIVVLIGGFSKHGRVLAHWDLNSMVDILQLTYAIIPFLKRSGTAVKLRCICLVKYDLANNKHTGTSLTFINDLPKCSWNYGWISVHDNLLQTIDSFSSKLNVIRNNHDVYVRSPTEKRGMACNWCLNNHIDPSIVTVCFKRYHVLSVWDLRHRVCSYSELDVLRPIYLVADHIAIATLYDSSLHWYMV